MAGALNRNMFRRQMEEGLNSVFGLNYKKHSPEWSMVFPTFKANKARMEDVLVSGFAGAAAKAEGASFQYVTAQELWTARYVMTTYALGFFITEEAIEDGLYGNLGSKYAAALARSMQYTKELEAAAVFNNGFDTNYPGGDGQPLFSTAHSTVAAGDQAAKVGFVRRPESMMNTPSNPHHSTGATGRTRSPSPLIRWPVRVAAKAALTSALRRASDAVKAFIGHRQCISVDRKRQPRTFRPG